MVRLEMSTARKDLADTVNRVAYQGERIVLRRRGKNMAALVSMDDLKLLEQLEDRLDLKQARRALADPRRIPYDQIRKELGLSKK